MNYTIIDVREPDEFADSHVEGALNIPLVEIMVGSKQLVDVKKDSPLLVYCRSGNRSRNAKEVLENNGFTDVTNGINENTVRSEYLQ